MENFCCSGEKSTKRSEEEKKSLKIRLNRIAGQITGISRMIDDDRYCPDILAQCAAVNRALEALEREVFTYHLRHCVSEEIREGNDSVIDETVDIVERLMR